MINYYLQDLVYNEEHNAFVSNVTDDKNNLITIKSSGLKLINFKNDGTLNVEFLYSTNDFYQCIKLLEDQFKSLILKHWEGWFDKETDIDTINNLFKTCIQLPGKIPSLPSMIFKIHEQCEVYRQKNKKKINLSDLKNNMEIELKIEIDGLYFYRNKCNVIYYVKEICVIDDITQSFDCLFGEDINDSLTETLVDESEDLNDY